MKKNNSFIDILGTIADGFFSIIKGFLRLFLKILVTFGLWLPVLYALLGVVLYYGADFDPFGFDVYSVIYLSGGVACLVCAGIITLRNIVVMPVKSVFQKKRDRDGRVADEEYLARTQAERTIAEEEERRLSPPMDYLEFDEKEEPDTREPEPSLLPEYLNEEDDGDLARGLLFNDWVPDRNIKTGLPVVKSVPRKEIPEIYFSKLNPNLLVYEYNDRFELYRTIGERTVYVGVEYK